jgi:hypothetical protein
LRTRTKTGLFPDVKRGRLGLMQAEQQQRVIENHLDDLLLFNE